MARYKVIDKKSDKAYAKIQKLRAKGWKIVFSNTATTILIKEKCYKSTTD